MASSPKKGKWEVPSSESVKNMNDSDVSSWINTLIGSSGECNTADSRRNLLQKYFQKQEAGVSTQPLPLSSRVDAMPLEEVSELLLNQIGSFAECKNEQSQRSLLKTYLLNRERKEPEESTIYIYRRSNDDENKHTFHEDDLRPGAKRLDSMDYVEVGTLISNLGMDITDVLANDRQRLKQRLFRGQRDDSCEKKMRVMLDKAMKAYKDKREKLIRYYTDIIDITGKASFETEMSKATECRFPHFRKELHSTKDFLQSLTDKVEIVFTGETSSGKSTFLNVLLAENILPSHPLHTTSCIFRLHNSRERRIEYIDRHGTRQQIPLKKDSSELREKLDSMTKEFLEYNAEHEPLQTIDVYWEIPSLHENVELVDTPGIGETDAMTKQVTEYIRDADGYIFVVDSGHAGGVQDGGIRKLIEMVAETTPEKEQITDLGNIFFVCNKCDMVERKHRNDVMQNTRSKLSRLCGHLEGWQVVEFNSLLELQLLEWKANTSDAFNNLLKSTETLITKTIQKRLDKSDRWLRTFVLGVQGFVNARMQTALMTKRTAKDIIQDVRNNLNLAAQTLEKCKDVQTSIDDEGKRLLQELRTYLNSERVRSELLDWTNSAPEPEELKTKGPELIKMRLQNAILDWASADESPLKVASYKIKGKCKEIQTEIDMQIRAINDIRLGLNLQTCSDEIAIEDYDRFKLVFIIVGVLSAIAALWLRVCGLVASGLSILWKKWTKKKTIEKITEMTMKALDELLTKDHLEKFITDSFTNPHSNCLAKVEKVTQGKISSTREVMLQIESDLKREIGAIDLLQPLHAELQKCLTEIEN